MRWSIWDWLFFLEASTATLFHVTAAALCVLLLVDGVRRLRRRR